MACQERNASSCARVAHGETDPAKMPQSEAPRLLLTDQAHPLIFFPVPPRLDVLPAKKKPVGDGRGEKMQND